MFFKMGYNYLFLWKLIIYLLANKDYVKIFIFKNINKFIKFYDF